MRFSAAFLVSALAANAMARCTKGGRHRQSSYNQQAEAVTTTTYYEAPAAQAPEYTTVPEVTTTFVKVYKTSTQAAAYTTTTAASSSSSGSSSGLDSDQKSALEAHNKARSEVGAKALSWSDSLAADALTWAQHLAETGSLVHSSTSGQGENLYMQSGSDNPLTNAVNSFLSEKSSYSAGTVIDSSNYQTFGHYTQCVWPSTYEVGMASATASDGSVWVVARYVDPGNYIGEKAY